MDTVENSSRSHGFVPSNVRLSDRDTTDMARLLALLTAKENDPGNIIAVRLDWDDADEHTASLSGRSTFIAAAKECLILRRTRSQFLDESIFSEPGWYMLLALYIAEETEARNSISLLTKFSGAESTIALRWISHLERLGYARQLPHPDNLRTSFIELTDDARHALDGYFSRVIAMGLCR